MYILAMLIGFLTIREIKIYSESNELPSPGLFGHGPQSQKNTSGTFS